MMCVWLALTLTTITATDHPITLLRAVSPGDKSDFSGQAVLEETVTLSNATGVLDRRTSGYAVDMKAVSEVVAVDDKGRATTVTFTVVYCTKTTDNRMSEMVPRGSVITATFENGEERFSREGTTLSEETTEALSILIVLADGGPSIDDVFGTAEPQGVGDRWPISVGPAAESFATAGITVLPANVSGDFGLMEETEVAGRPCLRIGGALHFSSLSVALPDPYTLQSGALLYRFEGLFPRETGLEPLREEKEMVLTLTSREKQRPEVAILSVTRQTARISRTPL